MPQQQYSRYEKARILGARALQVSYGAPVLVETEESQPILIAAEEYDAGVLPFSVRREGAE
ncbi:MULTISPECIES: DNA-directed RNA polymerase subunit K [unclassified Haladaptatus]|uniref:DNA-directed RNA polymerase subunit K n=1 Tax=unclassified Haladaptatus TaxID=2622732 RepID=UPI0007B4641D|nr:MULTISPECIES: DNA-directed RNA polymerase subunit K [unclassified Haladaptatus]KZN24011.1 DNA-directed RNA polymerase subunit K [Haladaptatus sp. R4]MCO8245910.1 DNA-directed RNA polymerase subunit K [Haladaptatus sp. AB643]MCO8254470.1 DNA-directed RNA polymerase subunit K [Haladaptatus sp. AB618]